MKKRHIRFVIEILIVFVLLAFLGMKNAGWLDHGSFRFFSDQGTIVQEKPEENAVETSVILGKEMEVNSEMEESKEEQEIPLEMEVTEGPEMDTDSPEGRALELGLPTPPDIDINSWEYILVNGEHTIDGSFVPEIGYAVSSSTSSEQDIRIVEALNAFAAAAEAQGLDVYLSSGYRSYDTQSYLFELKCQEYDYDTAATIVAVPGTSEHQTGLCCDITDIYRSPKNSDLEYTATYQWMSAHCTEYGFIVRYPKYKEDITKIIYEPWHFRYVGKEAAEYIMDNDLTLEEFVALYKG